MLVAVLEAVPGVFGWSTEVLLGAGAAAGAVVVCVGALASDDEDGVAPMSPEVLALVASAAWSDDMVTWDVGWNECTWKGGL